MLTSPSPLAPPNYSSFLLILFLPRGRIYPRLYHLKQIVSFGLVDGPRIPLLLKNLPAPRNPIASGPPSSPSLGTKNWSGAFRFSSLLILDPPLPLISFLLDRMFVTFPPRSEFRLRPNLSSLFSLLCYSFSSPIVRLTPPLTATSTDI